MAGENNDPSPREATRLETLSDVQREMAIVYRLMKSEKIEAKLGNSLFFGLSQIAGVMQDRRDSKHKKQLATLWAEHQKTLPADAVGH